MGNGRTNPSENPPVSRSRARCIKRDNPRLKSVIAFEIWSEESKGERAEH